MKLCSTDLNCEFEVCVQEHVIRKCHQTRVEMKISRKVESLDLFLHIISDRPFECGNGNGL